MKNINDLKIGINGKIQAFMLDNKINSIRALHVDNCEGFQKNLTPSAFLDALCDACTGTATDFEIKYIALSTAYDPPTKSTGLELELARFEPSSAIQKLGKRLIIEAEFDNTVVTASKNISSVTSTTVFVVNNVTGLSVGDRIQVKVAGNTLFEQRKITDITGTTITVHQAFSGLPVVGSDYCKQMISRLHLVYGASATSSLNSGSAISLATLKTSKLSTETLYTRHEIEFLST